MDTTAIRSPLTSLNFANLRIKDAIVDRLRDQTGDRPSIDTVRPDVRVMLFLQEGTALLYLDLSGEPLFKRGWRADREAKGEAPLKENLAAGLRLAKGGARIAGADHGVRAEHHRRLGVAHDLARHAGDRAGKRFARSRLTVRLGL